MLDGSSCGVSGNCVFRVVPVLPVPPPVDITVVLLFYTELPVDGVYGLVLYCVCYTATVDGYRGRCGRCYLCVLLASSCCPWGRSDRSYRCFAGVDGIDGVDGVVRSLISAVVGLGRCVLAVGPVDGVRPCGVRTVAVLPVVHHVR